MEEQSAKQALSLHGALTIAKIAHPFFILALHKEGASIAQAYPSN